MMIMRTVIMIMMGVMAMGRRGMMMVELRGVVIICWDDGIVV
jgi:hypothetical protein